MAVNYTPTDPVAGASRSTGVTEVQRWIDYADTIADVDTRLDTLEASPGGPSTAAELPIADAGGYFTGTDVEAALQELGAGGGGTVDVVSNVATSTILGRITAGSGDSEELTAAQVRTLLGIIDTSGARVYKTTTPQSVPDAAHTAITFNTEEFDDDAYHDTATNTSRLTIPTTGRYRIDGGMDIGANVTGIRLVTLWKNGVGTGTRLVNFTQPPTVFAARPLVSSGPVNLTAGDYVEMALYQDSGGALNVGVGAEMTWLAIERIA